MRESWVDGVEAICSSIYGERVATCERNVSVRKQSRNPWPLTVSTDIQAQALIHCEGKGGTLYWGVNWMGIYYNTIIDRLFSTHFRRYPLRIPKCLHILFKAWDSVEVYPDWIMCWEISCSTFNLLLHVNSDPFLELLNILEERFAHLSWQY